MNRWGLFVEGQQEEGILPALPGLGFGMSMFIPALGGHLATIPVTGQRISQSGLGAAVCRYACAGVARSRLPATIW